MLALRRKRREEATERIDNAAQPPDNIKRSRISKPPPKSISPPKPAIPLDKLTDPNIVIPKGYWRTDVGWWHSSSEDGSGATHISGPIDFLYRTRDESGTSWGLHLRTQDPDNNFHFLSLPNSLLATGEAEIRAKIMDLGCYVSTTAHGKAKFTELIGTIDVKARATAVDKTGWFGTCFVTPIGTIGDTPEKRVIYQAPITNKPTYRTKGTLEDWQPFAALAVGNTRLILGFSIALTGPLLGLLGEEGGGIHVRGASSTGKSTMLFAAASTWGPPEFVSSWSTTSNGLEAKCVEHNETVLILDEIAQLDPKDAAIAAYVIANGSGKARANRSGSLRQSAKWRVPFISSGEISLGELAARDSRGTKRSAAGQEVRILDVEADAGFGLGLFEQLHGASNAETFARKLKEGAATAYGVAGMAFVERIAMDRDGYVATLKQAIDGFVKDHVPSNANGQVARAGRRFGLFAAAGELAIGLGIVPWPAGEATKASATIFRQWMNGRGGTGSAEDREAVAKVRGFLEMHGGSRFEPLDPDEEPMRVHNRVGFWQKTEDSREYLFLPETWNNEVCAGLDPRRVAKVLAERGLLRKDSAGKNSVSVKLPIGKRSRCYAVSAHIFEEEVST